MFRKEMVVIDETWKRARAVPLPAPTNADALLQRAAYMAKTMESTKSHITPAHGMDHYNLSQVSGQKRKASAAKAIESEEKKEGICKHPQAFTIHGLPDCKQKDLQKEAKLHGVVSTPPNSEIVKRLTAHYENCQHSHKPLGAGSDAATTYYNAKPVAITEHFKKLKI